MKRICIGPIAVALAVSLCACGGNPAVSDPAPSTTTTQTTTTTTTTENTTTTTTADTTTTTAKPTSITANTTTTTTTTTKKPTTTTTTKKPTTTTCSPTTKPTRNPHALEVVDIVDHTDPSALYPSVMDFFYEDDMFIYAFGFPRPVVVYYADGSTKGVGDALKVGDILIEDLTKYGIGFYQEIKTTIPIPQEELAEKVYSKHTIEEDFEEGVVLVSFCNTISATNYLLTASELSDLFGMPIAEAKAIFRPDPSKANEGNCHHIYALKLCEKTKQAVLDAIKIIEQHPYVYCAEPNGVGVMH